METGKSDSGASRAVRAFLSSAHSAFQSASSSPIFSLLVLGLCLRLALAPFLTWTIDASVWYRSATDFMAGIGIYSSDTFSYPPLWAITFLPFVWLLSIIVPPQYLGTYSESFAAMVPQMYMMVPTITRPLFNLAFKLPLIIADTVVGLIIYKIALEFASPSRAKNAFALWYFNPLLIFCSTLLGQFDVFPAMMALLAILLLYKKNYFFCGIALGMGFLYKISPAFLIPLCAAFCAASTLREMEQIKSVAKKLAQVVIGWLKMCSGFFIPACIFLLPVLNSGIYNEVVSVRMQYETVNGMNLWFLGIHPKFSSAIAAFWDEWHSAVTILEVALVLCMSLVAFMTLLRTKGKGIEAFSVLVFCSVATLIVALLFPQKSNPNFIIWVLPFLIISYSIFNKWKIQTATAVLAGCIYYLSVGVPLPELLLNTISAYTGIISPALVARIAEIYMSCPGLITGHLVRDIHLLAAAAGVIALSFIAVDGIREAAPPQTLERIRGKLKKPAKWRN